jgi:hypothetical protein
MSKTSRPGRLCVAPAGGTLSRLRWSGYIATSISAHGCLLGLASQTRVSGSTRLVLGVPKAKGLTQRSFSKSLFCSEIWGRIFLWVGKQNIHSGVGCKILTESQVKLKILDISCFGRLQANCGLSLRATPFTTVGPRAGVLYFHPCVPTLGEVCRSCPRKGARLSSFFAETEAQKDYVTYVSRGILLRSPSIWNSVF